MIADQGLTQITDSGAIASLIDTIITANPDQVAQYRAGKDKVFGFFVGQVMKQSQGKANPQQVNLNPGIAHTKTQRTQRKTNH